MKKLLLVFFFVIYGSVIKAQWIQTNGPTGGNVNCITTYGNKVFAGSDRTGVFFSNNNGNSWVSANNGIGYNTIYALGSNSTTVFAGSLYGSYRSINNGNTWQTMLSSASIRCFSVTGDTIFAGGNGVYRSFNNGSTWIPVNSGLPSGPVNAIVKSDTAIYAGLNNGLYCSTDYGSSWINLNFMSGAGSSLPVSSILIKGNNIFVGTAGYGLYFSPDHGGTWLHLTNGLPLYTTFNSVVSLGSILYVGEYDGVYSSNDDGNTWTLLSSSPDFIKQLMTNGTDLFATTLNNNGVWRSSDYGISWNPANDGLIASNMNGLVNMGESIIAPSDQGLWSTSDNGITWDTLGKFQCFSMAYNNTNLFAGALGIKTSTNNGLTWSQLTNGLPFSGGNPVGAVYSMAANGNTIFAFIYQFGLYRSLNNGLTWTNVRPSSSTFRTFSIKISGSTIYTGTSDGVIVSFDNGNTWNTYNSGLPGSGAAANIYSLLLKDSTILAGTEYGVYKSVNNCVSWDSCNAGLPKFSGNYWGYTSLVLHGSDIFAINQYHQISRSNNNGLSWVSVIDNLPLDAPSYYPGPYLALTSSDIFLSMNFNGVWKRPLTEVIGINEITMSEGLVLYPNPAHDKLTINTDHKITILKCYNSVGQQMEIALQNNSIDISMLLSGIYYLQVISENGTLLNQKFIKL
jgi:hypothetical protein